MTITCNVFVSFVLFTRPVMISLLISVSNIPAFGEFMLIVSVTDFVALRRKEGKKRLSAAIQLWAEFA